MLSGHLPWVLPLFCLVYTYIKSADKAHDTTIVLFSDQGFFFGEVCPMYISVDIWDYTIFIAAWS